MISAKFAGNAACVRGIKTAFPPSSYLRVPAARNWEVQNLTARASRISRMPFLVAGRFVRTVEFKTAHDRHSQRDTSSAHFAGTAVRDA